MPGAVRYELQIEDTRAKVVSSDAEMVDGTPPSTEYAVTEELTNNTTYYWRVRAVDNDGTEGAWSSIASLQVEQGSIRGMKPQSGTITYNTTPSLSWDPVTDSATSYNVQIADNEAMTGVITGGSVPNTANTVKYTPPSELATGKYYWRVQAVYNGR